MGSKFKLAGSFLVLLVVMFTCTVFLTGCPSIQKALDTEAATRADAEKLGKELGEIESRLEQIKKDYDAAKKENSTEKMAAAVSAFNEVLKLYDEKRGTYNLAVDTWKNAAKQLESAKSTNDYIGAVIGIVVGALTGGVGGFVRGKTGKAALEGALDSTKGRLQAAVGALTKTASNVDLFLDGEDPKVREFKRSQLTALNTQELAALQGARGKAMPEPLLMPRPL